LSLAVNLVQDYLLPYTQGWEVWSNERTLEEATPDTSPGYPFKSQGFKTKEEVFSLWTGEPMYDPPIWEVINKDEILPKAKVDRGWIRTIVIPDATLYLTQLKYFGDFNLRLKDKPYQPGMFNPQFRFNPFYGGVGRVRDRCPDGWYVSTTDLTENDSHQSEELMRVVQWMRETASLEKISLKKLYDYEIHSCLAVANGQVLQKHHGQPSGSVNTTIDNTIRLLIYVSYAFIRLFGRIPTQDDFILYVLGDDCMWFTPHREFNHENVGRIWGVECGLLLKEGKTTDSIVGHTFLGWTFTEDGWKFAHPERFIDMLYYPQSKNPDYAELAASIAPYLYEDRDLYYKLWDLHEAVSQFSKFYYFPSRPVCETLKYGFNGGVGTPFKF
jgi:hypothetical protein